MDIRAIEVLPGGAVCTLRSSSGEIGRASIRAVGMALLGWAPSDESNLVEGVGIVWTDLLASHGVAIGTRGNRSWQIAVIPPRQREVAHIASGGLRTPLTLTFPPILVSLKFVGGRFNSARVFLVKPSALPRLAMRGFTEPCLTGFPYGNVYASGSVCWGSVQSADIRNLADFETLFFGSGFNGDLWAGGGGGLTALAGRAGGVIPPLPDTSFTQSISRTYGTDAE